MWVGTWGTPLNRIGTRLGMTKPWADSVMSSTSLAEARSKRDQARKLIESCTDPSRQKRLDRIKATATARSPFGAVAAEFLDFKAENGAAETAMSKNRWMLEDLAAPLANPPIDQIVPAEILDILKRNEKSGRRETAKKLRGMMGSVFRHAVVTHIYG